MYARSVGVKKLVGTGGPIPSCSKGRGSGIGRREGRGRSVYIGGGVAGK